MERTKTLLLIGLVLAMTLSACNLPMAAPVNNEPPPPPPEDEPAPPPPATDTPEPEPTEDPYANITHSMMPGSSITLVYWAYDCDTGRYTKTSDQPNIGGGCDQWEINFIERPTNKDLNMYYPHLDIVRFQMGKDDTWFYADIMTYSAAGVASELNGSYGLELDFDIDGDGDVLIFVNDPSAFPAGQWHAEGVQVWEDTNDDVGGDTPVISDPVNTGDGYETQLFDQGLGDDPDLAWVRIAPDDPATIDFAFKHSVVPNINNPILWWTWASQEPLKPGEFDYNDTFGPDEVHQIGNSCRWIFNGPPQPVLNICLYEQPESEPEREVHYCYLRYPIGGTYIENCIVCPSNCDNLPGGLSCGGACTPP